MDTDITGFDVWSVSNTYGLADIVTGSDNLHYQSLAASNLGNDPISTSALWEQFYFLPTWNTVQTYTKGQLAIASDGRTYQSQLGSNTSNDPISDSGTNWQILLQQDDDITLSGINLEKIEAGTVNLDYISASNLRWRWLFDTDETLNLERYNSSGVLQDKSLSFNNSTGALTTIGALTLTSGALTLTSGDLTLTNGSATFSKNTQAAAQALELTSDASQTASIQFQNVNIKRWEMGQDTSNNFALTSFDASGSTSQTVMIFPTGTTNMQLPLGNLLFPLVGQGFAVTNTAASTLDFNFTGVSTVTAAFEFFDNTTTTGTRSFNIWKGNVTNAITFQINAETGSIHTALDRAGETNAGVKLGKIILSTAAPSGGEDGDLWLRY